MATGGPTGARPLLRRVASPAGLVGVLLCLLLPFFGVSCSIEAEPPERPYGFRVTYTGADVVVPDRPDVEVTDPRVGGSRQLTDADLAAFWGVDRSAVPRTEPYGWLSVTLIVAALVAAAWRATPWAKRSHAALTAALALLAGLALLAATLTAREQAVDTVAQVARETMSGERSSGPIREWDRYAAVRAEFRFGYGFWLAHGLLLVVGMTNVALAVPGRRPQPATPSEPDEPDGVPDEPDGVPGEAGAPDGGSR